MPRRKPAEQDNGDDCLRPLSEQDLADFLLRTCHDLRSPARAIRTHAEILSKAAVPEDGNGNQSLDFILDNVRKIELLTEGLAAWSSALLLEPASFQPCDMQVMFRTALARLDQERLNRHAIVTCDELPCVSGDAGSLVQVFAQLLRNALRHSGCTSPKIHITARKEEHQWAFSVHDDGKGIEPEYLERIFKPFESLEGSRGGSVGLGLAICRMIVDRHGGKIWAESRPGNGTTLHFTLPAG